MSDEKQKQVFTKNLNKYINECGKTQIEIAQAIGVSPQTFNTWCRGIAIPRMGKVQALADYFHISKSELIEEKDDQSDSHYYLNDETRQIAQEAFENPELRTLFKVARDIPPERLRAHIEFMRTLKEQERGNHDEGC